MALGNNFDWLRQDIKPGQLNPNLIMDEEVFFSLLGKQTITQENGQQFDNTSGTGAVAERPVLAEVLNFCQITPISTPLALRVAPGNYIPGTMGTAGFNLPLTAGSSPVPMVVTSTDVLGNPASAYPVTSYPYGSNAMLALDPVTNYLYDNTGTPPSPLQPPYSNGLKAAFAQFLSLRHGGSGFIFGFGSGAVGQNTTVSPIVAPTTLTNRLVDGDSGGPTVPLAVVPGHQLHGDAAGGATAFALYQPAAGSFAGNGVDGAVRGQSIDVHVWSALEHLRGRPGGEELLAIRGVSVGLPGVDTHDLADGLDRRFADDLLWFPGSGTALSDGGDLAAAGGNVLAEVPAADPGAAAVPAGGRVQRCEHDGPADEHDGFALQRERDRRSFAQQPDDAGRYDHDAGAAGRAGAADIRRQQRRRPNTYYGALTNGVVSIYGPVGRVGHADRTRQRERTTSGDRPRRSHAGQPDRPARWTIASIPTGGRSRFSG